MKRKKAVRPAEGSPRHIVGTRPCNLCRNLFVMRSRFDRFCNTCKSEKDLLRFSEWLPNLPVAL